MTHHPPGHNTHLKQKIFDLYYVMSLVGFPCSSVAKNPPAVQETHVQSWVRQIPWRRKWQPTAVLLPGKFHGQGSLKSNSLWAHKELDMTEHARTHYSTYTSSVY